MLTLVEKTRSGLLILKCFWPFTLAVEAFTVAVIEQQLAFEYLVGRQCEFLSESPHNRLDTPPDCSSHKRHAVAA